MSPFSLALKGRGDTAIVIELVLKAPVFAFHDVTICICRVIFTGFWSVANVVASKRLSISFAVECVTLCCLECFVFGLAFYDC